MAVFQQINDPDLIFPTTHDYLFVQPGPPVQIIGKQVALDELQKGILVDGLFARLDMPSHATTAFEQSLEVLRQKNAFPTNEALLRFNTQSPELQLVGGVGSEDWIVKQTVQFSVHPPFNFHQLNVDFLLAFLRVAQTYHNEGRIYQLVILTQTNHAEYRVDVLPTVWGVRSTHSIYLYRSFAWPGGGMAVAEIWRGFGVRFGAQEAKAEVAPQPTYPQDLLQRVKRIQMRENDL